MRTPNKEIYAKRGIFFLSATDGAWVDSIWKGPKTEELKTNQEDEVGKYFSKRQKRKLSKPHEWRMRQAGQSNA